MYPDCSNYQICNFIELTGGAESQIFSFDFNIQNEGNVFSIPLILRVFWDSQRIFKAKREFQVLRALHKAKIPVPKPYLHGTLESMERKTFVVMERVKGVILDDKLMEVNEEQLLKLFSSFITGMVDLHSFDWNSIPIDLQTSDIDSDPYIIIRNSLKRPKELINKYNFLELNILIDWFEEHMFKMPCDQLVLVHGDFHPLNVIVKPDNSLIIVDWSNIRLSDFRMELGFAISTMNFYHSDTLRKLIKHYEAKMKTKVENIDYFMLLSNLNNITLMYCGLHNILEENEASAGKRILEFKLYVKTIFNLVENIAKIKLLSLESVVNDVN
jgi:aminoglycoside phosphotransferase (APT) family kinase protein